MACPRGTYSDVAGIYQESQCKPCPQGQYCDGEHISSPTGKSFPTKSIHLIFVTFYTPEVEDIGVFCFCLSLYLLRSFEYTIYRL